MDHLTPQLSEQEERAAFEQWFNEYMRFEMAMAMADDWFNRDEDGEYVVGDMAMMWRAWLGRARL